MDRREPGDESDLYGRESATRDAIDRIANRWTILVTHTLEEGPARFNELRSRLGVTSQVLARLLRDLERDGLVRRTVYAEVPVRVEYALTELGGSMCEPVGAVRDWAEKVWPQVLLNRETYDETHAEQD